MGNASDGTAGRASRASRRPTPVRAVASLQRAFHLSPVPIFVSRFSDGLIVDVNDALARLTGYTRDEMIGRSSIDLGLWESAADRARTLDALRGATEAGGVPVRVYARDGTPRDIVATGQIVEEKGTTFLVASLVDVTARLAAESALAASEHQFRQLFESMDSGCALHEIICDDAGRPIDFRYLRVNPAFERHSGLSGAVVVGRTAREVLPELDPELIARFGRVALAGEPDAFEFYVEALNSWYDVRTYCPRAGQFVAIIYDISDRKRAEAVVRESEERYRNLVELAQEGVWAIDSRGQTTFVNPRMAAMLGYAPGEMVGRSFLDFIPEAGRPAALDRLSRRMSGEIEQHEFEFSRKDGLPIPLMLSTGPIVGSDGEVRGALAVVSDLTAQKQAEADRERLRAQFLHAQKMEAIGRLAGGIAHDFNNLLTAILGHCDLAVDALHPDDPLSGSVQEIRASAERAAALTRQLLAFSRRRVASSQLLRFDGLLQAIESLLVRLIGEDIELTMGFATTRAVRGDRGQLEQVVMNLVVNARDAMPDGGRLSIDVADLSFEEPIHDGATTVPPGDWVVLSVADTGAGMDDAVIDRVFEPFFTTKESGKGTGLGLSTVYGIARAAGGFVGVSSRPGAGSTFRVYWPAVDAPADAVGGQPSGGVVRGGHETVLIAEDEDAVRRLTRAILRGHGYTVIEARDGREALEICRHDPREIHLLVTDVVMPAMGGVPLAREAARLRPSMRTLFLSGYTEDEILRQGVASSALQFLEKPYPAQALLARVREVLDGDATPVPVA